jgi:hypothetical protein
MVRQQFGRPTVPPLLPAHSISHSNSAPIHPQSFFFYKASEFQHRHALTKKSQISHRGLTTVECAEFIVTAITLLLSLDAHIGASTTKTAHRDRVGQQQSSLHNSSG